MDADQGQTRRFGVFCSFGLDQAGAPPDPTRVSRTQVQCLHTFLSTYALQSISYMLCAMFWKDWLGLGYENPHNT